MAPRFSAVRTDHVEYCFWLIFEEAGGVRITRGEPNLDRAERAVALTARLPRSLWSTPSLRATLTVEETPAPPIDIRMVADQLRTALGGDIDVRVLDGPPPQP